MGELGHKLGSFLRKLNQPGGVERHVVGEEDVNLSSLLGVNQEYEHMEKSLAERRARLRNDAQRAAFDADCRNLLDLEKEFRVLHHGGGDKKYTLKAEGLQKRIRELRSKLSSDR
jgi:hypothetical protein